MNLSDEQIDNGISQALKVLGEFTAVDRVSVFQFNDPTDMAKQTHRWHRESIDPYPEDLQVLVPEDYPLFSELIGSFSTVNISSIDDLPNDAEAEKKFLKRIGVKSIVAIPLVYNRHVIGCMRLETVTHSRSWSRETVNLVKLIAEIIVNTLMRKKAQQQLVEYNEKMFRAEQLASLGTISATVAHELNQPLTVIRLFLQQNLRALAQAKIDPAAIIENIEEILEEVANAESIVNRFRKFARKSSPITITKFDLLQVAQRVTESLRESARKASIEITLEFTEKVLVNGNIAEFEQIFFVLIQNAIQASSPLKKDKLTIIAEQVDKNIELSFEDTCGGVDEENEAKIFEPFFTTKSEIGTGLGLCILDRIVKRYRGELKIENIHGQGITFKIKLPADD